MRRRYVVTLISLVGIVLTLCTIQPGVADVRASVTYVVRPHDTLSGIAVAFGTTVRALMAANGLRDANHIVPGEVLVVPVAPAGTAAGAPAGAAKGAPGPAMIVHVVHPGDTLSALSVRFGLPEAALAAANGLPEDARLYIGQRLHVPLGWRGSYATPTPIASGSTGIAPTPAASGSTGVPPTPVVSESTNPSPTPVASGSSSLSTASPATPTAVTGVAGGSVSAILRAQAQAAGVDPTLVEAVAWQESGWQMVTAADGGIGVMQLMPDTVAWVSASLLGTSIDPYNVVDNIRAGVAILRYYLRVFDGDVSLAVAAYHQGLRSVQTVGITAEGARYVANVLALQQRFAGMAG